MTNTIEVLSDILTQLDARQNEHMDLAGTESRPLRGAIRIIRRALLKEADKDVSNSPFNSPFDKLVDRRISLIKTILHKKGNEYATNDDRFHNFNAAGKKRNQTPEQALMGMMAKHEVSVDDIVEWAGISPERITEKLIDEKIGDNIVYLILLEGLLRKRIGE